jgi:hypothetical protein
MVDVNVTGPMSRWEGPMAIKKKAKLTSKRTSSTTPPAAGRTKSGKKAASTRGRRAPSRPARPRSPSRRGAVNRVSETLATALGGVSEATLELSSTAMSVVGNSVRAAQQIGGEMVKATAAAAADSLEAAQRAWRSDVTPREGSRPSPPRRR